jgi:hypothetical protein
LNGGSGSDTTGAVVVGAEVVVGEVEEGAVVEGAVVVEDGDDVEGCVVVVVVVGPASSDASAVSAADA